MKSSRFVCIHGHFYQPARENPWTGEIPPATDAYPFRDWNERISAESYGPNAWAQIRDQKGQVAEVVNNYERISFDFGPTLLSWLEAHRRHVYDAILAADKASQSNFSGHGSALAQCHNHMIMPLADRRDKVTQIVWGIRDFAHRFGRDPEGMWLPETAVDLETLDLLAKHGIKFTILAPRQITATRQVETSRWTQSPDESADSHHPYLVRLPSGRSIAVFVYDGAISRSVAFEHLLAIGDQFASRLVSAFQEHAPSSQLVHIATDGETYGHHHKFGEMALAYAIHLIGQRTDVRLTNYGEYLEMHPPMYEARVQENTSWSCIHGVERWRGDCGCSIRAHPNWNQKWRAPLRDALDWLRDVVNPRFEAVCGIYLKDPWEARNDYIAVLLDPGKDSDREFFSRHQIKRLTPSARQELLALLRMQRHMMLMYSSCGWFFDDISGLEATMTLQHAGWVIEQSRELLGLDLLGDFLGRLREARSNVPSEGDGAAIFGRACAPR